MNEVKEKIENKIYEIRGKFVILARDLAKLYGIETRILNQKVHRNKAKFLDGQYFQMSEEEFHDWRSRVVMSREDKKGLRRC